MKVAFTHTINCPQLLDTLGNLILADAIHEAGNVVLVSKLLQSKALQHKSDTVFMDDSEAYDSAEYSDPMFMEQAVAGYASLPTNANYQEDVKICRSFFQSTRFKAATNMHLAFGWRCCSILPRLQSFSVGTNLKRSSTIVVMWRFRIFATSPVHDKDLSTTKYPVMFYALDVDQPFTGDFDPKMIEGKIVIFGFLGEYFGDPSWDDKFFTPLNKKVSGRANPDMFGPVVHANIVAMVLNEDYINELSEWQKYLIAVIICFLNVVIFYGIHRRLPLWFDSLSLLLQVLQIVLLMGFTIWLFRNQVSSLILR